MRSKNASFIPRDLAGSMSTKQPLVFSYVLTFEVASLFPSLYEID
jgi:hypothetical protein